MTSIASAAVLAATLAAAPALAAPVLPAFDPGAFTPGRAIDNPYFPVLPGPARAYQGTDEDGLTERSVVSFAGPGRTLLGVETTALRDRETLDGVLFEETLDYYAQDDAGNVWYMGEDTTNYRYDADGNFVGTDTASAWLAGENGAEPGYVMPGEPVVGLAYYQEFAAADAALDAAEIFALGRTVEVAGVIYEDVLVTLEGTELEPDLRELKSYAPGIGLILVEEDLDEDLADPALRLELTDTVAPVPLPGALPMLLAGLGALALWRRGA